MKLIITTFSIPQSTQIKKHKLPDSRLALFRIESICGLILMTGDFCGEKMHGLSQSMHGRADRYSNIHMLTQAVLQTQ